MMDARKQGGTAGGRRGLCAGTALALALTIVPLSPALSQGGPPFIMDPTSVPSSSAPTAGATAAGGATAGTQAVADEQASVYADWLNGEFGAKLSATTQFDASASVSVGASAEIQFLLWECSAYAQANAGFSVSAGANIAAGLTVGAEACEGMIDFSASANAEVGAGADAGYQCSGPDIDIDIPTSLCEVKSLADSAMDYLAMHIPDDFNHFIEELVTFIDLDLNRTATKEIITRLDEYDKRLYGPLNRWWNDGEGDLMTPQDPYFTRCDPDETGDARCGTPSCPDDADPLCDAAQDLTDDDSDLEYDETDVCGGLGQPPCTSTLPALRAMMRQISLVKIWQTMQIGFMIDAQLLVEKMREQNALEVARRPRYAPSETSCQVDGMAAGLSASVQFSNRLYFAMTREDTLRRNNHIDMTPAYAEAAPGGDGKGIVKTAHAAAPDPVTLPMEPLGGGFAEQIAVLWNEYTTRYCTSLYGDQGCPADAPVSSAGKNRDLPVQIWGNVQTIDMIDSGSYENYYNIRDALRTLISPFAPEPMPADALKNSRGQEEWLKRRARDARINAIWNVMAKIAADRASGSGVDGNDIRAAAGVPLDTTNPPIPAAQNGTGSQPLGSAADTGGESLAALRELINKTRYYNPQYVTRLVNTPEVVQRERLTALAAQSEITQDWYRRMEEMVFMEAAMLADELDKEQELPRFSTVKLQTGTP